MTEDDPQGPMGLENYDVLAAGDVVHEAESDDAPPDSERKLGAFPNPNLKESPVVPLGFDGGKVVFAMPEGEIRFELASKTASMLRTDIYACQAGQSFLAYWRDSEDKFQAQLCAIWFNRACRAAGKWDKRRQFRSYGLWPSKAGPVLHAGDAVRLPDGTWVNVVDALRGMKDGPAWQLMPPKRPRPDKPATALDGQWLRDTLDRWTFRDLEPNGLSEADIVMGFQGVALMGACAPFRPILLVSAQFGGGKTTLSKLLHASASALSGDLLDGFSEAGFRTAVAGEARAVYLDEGEAAPDGRGPVEQAFEVLRRMVTGDGANRVQGDGKGGVTSQTAVGSVYLGAATPPPLDGAMATRTVEVRLGRLPRAAAGIDDILREATERAKELAPAFLARAIRDSARFLNDVAHLKAALGTAGERPREADLIAALAAGRRLLLHDAPLDEDSARDEVRSWRPLLGQRSETESTSNLGQECLDVLMSADSGQHTGGARQTIGDLVRRILSREGGGDYDTVLESFGLKVEVDAPATAGYPARPGPWLRVSNTHPRLRTSVFANTKFGNWRGSLMYLADLGEAFAPVAAGNGRFRPAHQAKTIAVPLTPWVGEALASSASASTSSRARPGPSQPTVPGEDDEFPM